MAKEKTSKTNVTARAEGKGASSLCRICGNKVDVIMRFPGKQMARLCCERAGARAS